MVEKNVTVSNRAGIHARPAALIAQTANKFSSSIFIYYDTAEINAKSIMGIITMAAAYNTALRITASGDDETDALNAIVSLFENRFEED